MNRLVAKLRHEPVAFWGGLLAALLAVLTYLGVDQNTLGLVGTVATLLGIPLVRSQVSPVAPPADGEAGHSDLELVLVVATAIGVTLLLFGVTFR